MASFWKSNPCAPTWAGLFANMWSNSPPKVLDSQHHLQEAPLQGCSVRQAKDADCQAIVEFWIRYFSCSSRCKCVVSVSHLKKIMSTSPIFLIVRGDGVILGSIAKRYMKGLHIQNARWEKAAYIDFFCVHPGWRNRGLGRALLTAVHNERLVPAIFLLEGIKNSIPPVSLGCFLVKKVHGQTPLTQITDLEICKREWMLSVRSADIWTEDYGIEITFWNTEKGVVIIWDIHHRMIPDGSSIGIIIGGSIEAANSFASGKSRWGYLLLPRSPFSSEEGWTYDSVFQNIAYNVSLGFISMKFPLLGF